MGIFGRRKPDLVAAWREVARVLDDPESDPAALSAAAQACTAAIPKSRPEEREAALAETIRAVRDWSLEPASLAALCAGAIVEAGGPPETLHAALLGRLPGLLRDAARFASAVTQAVPEAPEDEEEDEDADELWVGRRRVPPDTLEALHDKDPEALEAWFALERFAMATVAITGGDAARVRGLREAVRGPALSALAEVSGPAGMLRDACDTAVDESFLLVHGLTGRVFELRVDGVASNFDLHEGAAAAVAPKVGDKARRGRGTWNVYDWRAARHDVGLPDRVPREHWVWNEGRPSEVPPFDGTRVLVVGPPSYERTWNVGPDRPRVSLVRELPATEAAAFLARLRGAPPA